jgi:hypothetical protein
MEARTEKLTLFFDRIKTITFWKRIFGWNSLKSLSYEAYEEFKSLMGSADRVSRELDQTKNALGLAQRDTEHLKSSHTALESELKRTEEELRSDEDRISEMKASLATKDETIKLAERKVTEQGNEIALLKQRVDQLARDLSEVEQENVAFRQNESGRQKELENKIATLTQEIERVRTERHREKEEQQEAEIHRLESMRETWAKHEENVKSAIKMICQKHTIEYVENVPFKGSPDNTIKISDEFVVFDAKSPASDDLENFPTYIKSQTEAVKKYAKEENVRRDIFLVVPANTVEVIQQFSYNMADYSVYIVTLDVLEPLILALRKIEEYEFVNQLSPEERDNVCRVIGKFAHLTKRRIQIDHFFAMEFLAVLTKCKVDLPKDILEKVIESEKAEKLNPPQEKRAKQIPTQELQSDADRIRREAEAKAIVFPPSLQDQLNLLPLYEDEKSKSTEHS